MQKSLQRAIERWQPTGLVAECLNIKSLMSLKFLLYIRLSIHPINEYFLVWPQGGRFRSQPQDLTVYTHGHQSVLYPL